MTIYLHTYIHTRSHVHSSRLDEAYITGACSTFLWATLYNNLHFIYHCPKAVHFRNSRVCSSFGTDIYKSYNWILIIAINIHPLTVLLGYNARNSMWSHDYIEQANHMKIHGETPSNEYSCSVIDRCRQPVSVKKKTLKRVCPKTLLKVQMHWCVRTLVAPNCITVSCACAQSAVGFDVRWPTDDDGKRSNSWRTMLDGTIGLSRVCA